MNIDIELIMEDTILTIKHAALMGKELPRVFRVGDDKSSGTFPTSLWCPKCGPVRLTCMYY